MPTKKKPNISVTEQNISDEEVQQQQESNTITETPVKSDSNDKFANLKIPKGYILTNKGTILSIKAYNQRVNSSKKGVQAKKIKREQQKVKKEEPVTREDPKHLQASPEEQQAEMVVVKKKKPKRKVVIVEGSDEDNIETTKQQVDMDVKPRKKPVVRKSKAPKRQQQTPQPVIGTNVNPFQSRLQGNKYAGLFGL